MSKVVLLGVRGFLASRIAGRLTATRPGLELTALGKETLDLTQPGAGDALAGHLDGETTLLVCSGIKRQQGDDLDTFQANLAIGQSVCRALERAPAARVVYLSSTAVYGEETEGLGITETTPVRANSYYGLAKIATEYMLQRTCGDETALLLLRPATIYGPGDEPPSYGPGSFTRAAALGETIALWGDGSERRDFVFIDDVVRAICALAFGEARGVLNVVTGQPGRFADVLEVLGRIAPAELSTTSRARSKQQVDHTFDPAALRAALPGFEWTPLERGLERLLQHERA